MAQEITASRQHGNAYNLFVLVLTVLSLVLMVVMFLPLDSETLNLLQVYDNLICTIFLIDFLFNLWAAPKKWDYFIKERGWLDLIGSIPSLGGIFKYSGLFRLARLSRFARTRRILRGNNKKQMVDDVLKNRGNYATFITILLTMMILSVSSVLVLQFENQAPGSNIHTGGDALWYSIVTITTVGYGDHYPVSAWGRITGMFIMFTGVGIIGALASILSSLLVGGSSVPEAAPAVEPASTVEQELTGIKNELAALRQLLEKKTQNDDQSRREP